MNKYVLITGGAGFIGSHLCEKFHREGYQIIIIDSLFRGKKENVEHLLDDANIFFQVDLSIHSSIKDLATIIERYRPVYVLHYAAINGTQYFYDIPARVAEVNSIATYYLMLALGEVTQKNADYKPLIAFASTSETYGEPFRIPSTESDITYVRIEENRDSYAAGKLMSEFYVKLFAQQFGVDWMVFRIFNVYGPRMIGTKYGQVIPEFVERLKAGEYPLKILGNGEHTRSFIYIDDHVELTFQCVTKAVRNDVYNLGNPSEISIRQLGALIMEIMGKEPKFNFLPERRGDHRRRVPDISKLISQVGPHEFLPLQHGITKLLVN